MKSVLINYNVLNLNLPSSAGLVSGLKLLQSKGCDLYADFNISKLESFISRIFDLENIRFNEKDTNITYDYVITSLDSNYLLINNKYKSDSFESAAAYVISGLRTAVVSRFTRETKINVKVSLDCNDESIISTGLGFFDHMLSQIARHGNIHLELKADGDLDVDEHHTVEDTGLALGEALATALGDKKGIKRYGFFLPMDDAVSYCAIDLGGRAYLKFNVKFLRTSVGGFPTELTEEFFRALSSGMKANIYIKGSGKNDHHKIESVFKAFAKALNEACRIDERASGKLPTTKGII